MTDKLTDNPFALFKKLLAESPPPPCPLWPVPHEHERLARLDEFPLEVVVCPKARPDELVMVDRGRVVVRQRIVRRTV